MHGKYFLFTVCVIFLLIAPASASLAKIAAQSPVFIGESNIDISSGLNGCHTIAWWQNGTIMDAPPAKNITIYEMNTVSEKIYHFNFSLEQFAGSAGTWYCVDKLPYYPVFDLRDPKISIRVWDLDHDQDVTGMTVPRATNITYRIDTNLYPALNYLNRPNYNPADGFFTVKLTDPRSRSVPNIYTGTYGVAGTEILPFDSNPFITSSPYYWKDGNAWDHTARNIQGDAIYPPGTYSFTLTQNLNHMQQSYAAGSTGPEGKTISAATVTFPAPEPLTPPTLSVTVAPTLPEVTVTSPPTPVSPAATAIPTTSPIPKKTTYAPLPAWAALLGVGIVALLAGVRRNT